MWCEKCGYGSAVMKPHEDRCVQCGNKTFEKDRPFPNRPIRSIRDMKKRKFVEKDKKTNRILSEEVTEVIKEAGSLK